MIKLQVVGHLGRDCVVKEVNGKNVMSFTIAHSEKFKDQQGNQKEKTTWVDCSYWSDRTAVAPYLKKGTLVYVEGTPEADTYQNKEGQYVATLRLRVLSVQLLGGTNKEGQAGQEQNGALSSNGQHEAVGSEASGPSDDLPF